MSPQRETTTRKPKLRYESDGATLTRLAERHLLERLSQDPPRKTRDDPDEGPVGSVTAPRR